MSEQTKLTDAVWRKIGDDLHLRVLRILDDDRLGETLGSLLCGLRGRGANKLHDALAVRVGLNPIELRKEGDE